MKKIIKSLTKENIMFLIVSFVVMFFLTTTSPFYAINRSLDANTMLTVGKGLLHGLMPYKDLFDNRGPLIYLIHSANALVDYHSYILIYVIESLLLFLDLVYLKRIFAFRLSSKVAITCSFLFIPVAFTSRLFFYGDLPEEYAMSFLLILIYSIIKYDWYDMPRRYYVVNGIFIAILFWIKYSLIIPWVIFFAFLFFACLFTKRFKDLGIIILDAVVGFLVVTVPILLLYLFTGALKDMFYDYFYLNLTHYHVQDTAGMYLLSKILLPTFGLHSHFIIIRTVYFLMIFLFIAAVVKYVQQSKMTDGNKFLLALLTFLDIALTYDVGGASFSYYLFACLPFLFFFLHYVGQFLERYADKNWILVSLSVIAFLGIFVTNNNYRSSTYVAGSNRLYETSFAKHINRSKDKSILNYYALDTGMYTYTDTYAKNLYFVRNNINFKPMGKTQRQYLHSLKYKFVVTKYYPDELLPKKDRNFLKKHYRRVEDRWYNYRSHHQGKVALYERKN